MSFPCSLCPSKSYDDNQKLKQHLRRSHGQFSGNKSVECAFAPVCKEKFLRVAEMREHLISVHGITVEVDEIEKTFDTVKELINWKDENIENISNDRYVKHADRLIFYCHRSGHARVKENKTKKSKSQGSRKIGLHCISQIKLEKNDLGKYKAIWIKTHTGHEEEVEQGKIDGKSRSVIFGSLAFGLSPRAIVNKLKSNDKSNRLYHLTVKDVCNVRRDTGIGDVERGELHQEDATSVHIFVKNDHEKNVILYKPNRVINPKYPKLNTTDFAIAFMTQFQIDRCDQLLNEYSVVCLDATHGIGHGFKMITVLTVDEFYQGLPLAFCISKSEKADVLHYFFEAIKNRVGKPLITNHFMSDDAEYYFNTWKSVMDLENKFQINKWICDWHVNKSFTRQSKTKIRNESKRKTAVDLLMSLKS